MKKSVCVGLGPCPFFRCRQCSCEEQEGFGGGEMGEVSKQGSWLGYLSRMV